MNVLFLSSSYPIFKKGHWQNWSPRHETAKRLVEKGINVFVIAPHTDNAETEETIDGVKIYRFGKNAPLDFRKINPFSLMKYMWQFNAKAKEVCEKNRIDLIHAFWAIPSGTIALRTAKKQKIPYTVELLGSDVFFGLKNFFTRHFVKEAIEKADFVFADGPSLIEFAKEKRVKMKKTFVHFYEPEMPNPGKEKIMEMQKKWGLKESDFVIMLSRFKSKIYGAEFAIKAMPKILEKIPNAKLLLVGKGAEYESVVKEEIEKAGIQDKVIRTGFLEKPEYWCALNLTDIYLSPSLSDSTSVGLLEAMFAEKPIIASNIGDNPYWIKNGFNGKIVPVENAEAIADAAIEMHSKDLKSIGKASQKILEKECCKWNGIIEKYIEIYKGLV